MDTDSSGHGGAHDASRAHDVWTDEQRGSPGDRAVRREDIAYQAREPSERGPSEDQPTQPVLRVVRGTPDDVELAALAVVISGIVAAGGARPEPDRRSGWSDPRAVLRRPISHGPGAWRASGLPG